MIFPTLHFNIERWKFNPEAGVYVSTMGRFKSRSKKKLFTFVNEPGYCIVKTQAGLKAAHRLVLSTWKPIANEENMTVDHLNHNKRDNTLKNLEWVTKKENERRASESFVSWRDQVDHDHIILNDEAPRSISSVVSMIVSQHQHKDCSAQDVRQYIINFINDGNPNRPTAKKYGYKFKRVMLND